ncbi:MAG: peptidylprolyl isomerase [Actinobacteria bacterium]|nr:peptidylprolyl isomerase [Actinomycetota bacterium]
MPLRHLCDAILPVCLAVLTIAVASGCGGTGSAGAGATVAPSDGGTVMARVDGVEVTRADVDAILAEARLEGRTLDWSQALDQAVRRVLVRHAAARAGLTVDAAAVQTGLSAIGERSGGEAALTAALKKAGLTRDQLKAAVAAGLLEGGLADAQFPGLRAGEAAVSSFYRRNADVLFTKAAEVRLGKITVPGELIADKVAARLAAGAPFGPTARRFSMDPETRFEGGLLGWVSVPSLPPEVRAALAGLRAGDVTGPVRSFGRWQLFKLFGRRPARLTPFADVAEPIRRELTRRRRAAALDDWLARARARATVEILP